MDEYKYYLIADNVEYITVQKEGEKKVITSKIIYPNRIKNFIRKIFGYPLIQPRTVWYYKYVIFPEYYSLNELLSSFEDLLYKENENKIFRKASICVHLIKGPSITKYFNSDEEAQTYLENNILSKIQTKIICI